ncbi:MAG TPA: hypothetical protein VEI26_17510 [Terriglobales bacterium]|nr:hypothetical protein [Terriglobales bacterium]
MSKLSQRAVSTCLLGFLLVCGILYAASEPSSSEEQLPAGAAKAQAESACLGCHEARIILQQRLTKAAWTKEVDKMIKWGAEVDPNDRDSLIDYLSANFAPETPPYQAPRTETAKGQKRK